MKVPPTLAQVAAISPTPCFPLIGTAPAPAVPARTTATMKSHDFRIGTSLVSDQRKSALVLSNNRSGTKFAILMFSVSSMKTHHVATISAGYNAKGVGQPG